MRLDRLFNVQGQVALVTGAASGLGLAYAEVLAENGATVLLTDIDEPGLTAQVERLGTLGCDVAQQVLDIADTDAIRTVIDDWAARHGRLDIVFANAGISAGRGFALDPSGTLTEVDADAFRRVVDINLTGNLMTMAHAARHMKRQKSGAIVATTSVAGIVAEPVCGYAYVASKAALANAVRQAAVDLAPYNVRVNAIAPGPFLTNIAGGRLKREKDVAAFFTGGVPLQRLAEPDEIKGLALLLASPAGSYMTGTVIPIDGGSSCVLPGRLPALPTD